MSTETHPETDKTDENESTQMGGNIAAKESYEELTPKQAKIADAWSSYPVPEAEAEFHTVLEKVAADADSSESYAKEVYDEYGHIITEIREDAASELSDDPETDEPKRRLGAAESDESADTDGGAESDSESDSESQSESKLSAERVDVPGRPSVHDKRTPASEKEVDHYACPFCEFTHGTERTVRLHITREDAGKHKNRNAFLDQLYVPAIARDGSEIDEFDSPKTAEFSGTFDTSFLPESVDPDSKAAEILETAIKNPTASNSEIAEKVYGEDGNYAYVYQVLDRHLSARGTDEPNGEKAEDRKGWSDLTDKQQATIREYVADPDAPRSTLEERAGVSNAYSYTVLSDDKYQYVADHILARVEAGTVSLDDLDEGRALPIDFDKPTPQQIETATPDPAESEDEDESEAEPEPEPEPEQVERDDTATPPATEPQDEYIRVPRDRLREFAAETDRLKASAMHDTDIAPDESAMAIAARKQLYAINHVEEFLRDLADASSFDGERDDDE